MDRQWMGEPGAQMAEATDPWLQHPDGSVVDLTEHLDRLPRGTCEECPMGFFAPTGNGPTEQGIERCDACDTWTGDLMAAAALSLVIGQGVTVWYQADPDTTSDEQEK